MIDYYLRFHSNSPYRAVENPPKFMDKEGNFSSFGLSRMPRHLKLMTIGLAVSTLFILIRYVPMQQTRNLLTYFVARFTVRSSLLTVGMAG